MVFKSTPKKKAVKKAQPKAEPDKSGGVPTYYTTYTCSCGLVVTTREPSPIYHKANCVKCGTRMGVTFKKAGD